jgi:hypothetical protein
MKKLHLIFLVLSVVGMSSCSHDEETTCSVGQSSQPVVFEIELEDPITRASMMTVSEFSKYAVYAINAIEGDRVAKNTIFTKNGDTWTQTGTLDWPVNGDPLNFYSANASLEKTTATKNPGPFDKVTLSSTKQNLDYTVPESTDDQMDLMLASAFNRTAAQNGGKVKMRFVHSLAYFNFMIENGMGDEYVVDIGGITLYNMISNGTFSYSKTAESSGTWVAGTTRGKMERVFREPFRIPDEIDYLVDKDTLFMVIPQAKTTKWKTKKTAPIPLSEADANGHTYVKLLCKIMDKGGNYIYGSADTYGDVYLPFNAKVSSMGQVYTYEITFAGGYDENGEALAFGSGFDIEVVDWDETPGADPIEVEF